MAEILDAAGDALIIRRPNGSVYLDTRDRSVALGVKQTYTDVVLSFPGHSEAYNKDSSNEGRWWSYAAELNYQAVIGPIAFTPNWIWANLRVKSRVGTTAANTFGPNWGTVVRCPQVLQAGAGRSIPMIGSVLLEYVLAQNGATPINRHMSLGVSGGNLVINAKQSNADYTSPRVFIASNHVFKTATTWIFDIDIEAGIYDL